MHRIFARSFEVVVCKSAVADSLGTAHSVGGPVCMSSFGCCIEYGILGTLSQLPSSPLSRHCQLLLSEIRHTQSAPWFSPPSFLTFFASRETIRAHSAFPFLMGPLSSLNPPRSLEREALASNNGNPCLLARIGELARHACVASRPCAALWPSGQCLHDRNRPCYHLVCACPKAPRPRL